MMPVSSVLHGKGGGRGGGGGGGREGVIVDEVRYVYIHSQCS